MVITLNLSKFLGIFSCNVSLRWSIVADTLDSGVGTISKNILHNCQLYRDFKPFLVVNGWTIMFTRGKPDQKQVKEEVTNVGIKEKGVLKILVKVVHYFDELHSISDQ